jgi:hypothetical protein
MANQRLHVIEQRVGDVHAGYLLLQTQQGIR